MDEKTVLDFTMKDIRGTEVPLREYAGRILMIVNVASKCGLTPQYAGLQTLWERYGGRGFSILGFPANNFLWQEPGDNQQIQSFCTGTFGVSFPLFSKISVRGRGMHPLYGFLTGKEQTRVSQDRSPGTSPSSWWTARGKLLDDSIPAWSRCPPK